MTDLREHLRHIRDRAGSLSYTAEATDDDVRQAFGYISDLAVALIDILDAQNGKSGTSS